MKRLLACLLSAVLLLNLLPNVSAAPGDPLPLSIHTASVSLKSDLSLNFYVEPAMVEGFQDVYMRFEKPVYHGAEQTLVTETVTEYALRNGYRVYTMRHIAAREIGTTITATLCGTRNGEVVEGPPVEFSVGQYCHSLLAVSEDMGLKRLLVNLLNYGAAAQRYWDYRTDALANADLTAEQLALTADQPVVWYDHYSATAMPNAPAEIRQCSVSLQERVTLNYYLDLSHCPTGRDGLELAVHMGGYTATIPGSDFVLRDNGLYMAQLRDLNAAQMRTVCRAELRKKADGESLTPTVSYSIETYAKAISIDPDPKLAALAEAMMRYGDSAMEYLRGQKSASTDDAAIDLQGLSRDAKTGTAVWKLRLQNAGGGMIALDAGAAYADLKMILLLPAGMELEKVDSGEYAQLLKAAPQTVENYLGTGKTAVILPLDAKPVKQYAAGTSIRPAFTVRTHLEKDNGGELTAEAYLVSRELSVLPDTCLTRPARYGYDHYDMDNDGNSLEILRRAIFTFPEDAFDEGEGEI